MKTYVWLEETDLPSIIEGSWGMSEGTDFLTKIKQCTEPVYDWGRRLCFYYREEINGCRRDIKYREKEDAVVV